MAVDEIMCRYKGHAKETTTVPNKPIPTGFKVWAVAQQGFVICWNWHIPGERNGPVGIKTPVELGGTKKTGKGGNKTQAVVIALLQRLPQPPAGFRYHCYLDNLFVSTKLLLYARKLGFSLTGTCRTNSGIVKDLIDLKVSDKDDHIPWGSVYNFTTLDGLISQIGWKDQAFVLMMSTCFSGQEEKILRLRKRPKPTASKAKTSRAVFGSLSEKVLGIPAIADGYNYRMGAVDEFDHLTSQNPGLRPIKRGGHQAIEHWLLRIVLINCYLIAKRSDIPPPRSINFRSQMDFRSQLVTSLLLLGEEQYRNPKKRVGIVDSTADKLDPAFHQQVRMDKRGVCINCRGGRFSDRPRKRIALAEIAVNNNRQTQNRKSIFGCKECNIHLCQDRSCFAEFHNN